MGIAEMPLADQKDYDAEHALDVLIEASMIEGDEKMMGRVAETADKRAEEASRIAREHGSETTHAPTHPDRDVNNRKALFNG